VKRRGSARLDWVEYDGDTWWDRYNAYLQSPEWHAKRKEAFAKWGTACPCGADATQVDHLTYRRVGKEAVRDLLPLCAACHAKVTDARTAAGVKSGIGYLRVTEDVLGVSLSERLPLDAGRRTMLIPTHEHTMHVTVAQKAALPKGDAALARDAKEQRRAAKEARDAARKAIANAEDLAARLEEDKRLAGQRVSRTASAGDRATWQKVINIIDGGGES
jgi:hypothetical protein